MRILKERGEVMSFMDAEFPRTSFYDTDLRELLALYKKLSEEYDEIKSEIDEAVQFINEFEDKISDEVQRVAEEELKKINNRVDVLMQAVNKQAEDVQSGLDEINKFDSRMNKFDAELIKLRNEIGLAKAEVLLVVARLTEKFANYKDSMGEMFEGERQRLEQFIIEKVTTIDRLDVVNPIDGKPEEVGEVIRQIYELITNGYGLTAQEYDELGLEALEYDRMRITALDYSMKGWFKFFKLTQLSMKNLWTGGVMTIFEAIEKLADYHRNSLTAQDYDALGKTAQEYDELNLDTYSYDWNGTVYVY